MTKLDKNATLISAGPIAAPEDPVKRELIDSLSSLVNGFHARGVPISVVREQLLIVSEQCANVELAQRIAIGVRNEMMRREAAARAAEEKKAIDDATLTGDGIANDGGGAKVVSLARSRQRRKRS